MTLPLNFLPDLTLAFLLVFARTGAIFMSLPGFGELFFPARLRLALALAVSFIMLPALRGEFGAVPADLAPLLFMLGKEILCGLFIGLAVRFVRAALETAGAVIAQQIGIGFVTQVDPSQGGQGIILGNFLALLGVVLVFSTNLHHLAFAAIHDSYTLFPPKETFEIGDFTQNALKIFAGSFALAIQISAPFLVAALVFQVAIGVLSRLMPQLQIFFLALPLQMIGGFLLLSILLTTMSAWYLTHVDSTFHLFMVR